MRTFKTFFALTEESGEHLAVIGLKEETNIYSIEPMDNKELLSKIKTAIEQEKEYEEAEVISCSFNKYDYTWTLEVRELISGDDAGEEIFALSSTRIF